MWIPDWRSNAGRLANRSKAQGMYIQVLGQITTTAIFVVSASLVFANGNMTCAQGVYITKFIT